MSVSCHSKKLFFQHLLVLSFLSSEFDREDKLDTKTFLLSTKMVAVGREALTDYVASNL